MNVIIEPVPENCSECPLHSEKFVCAIAPEDKREWAFDGYGKPEWCPLKGGETDGCCQGD